MRSNWLAYLPADSQLLVAQLNNVGNNMSASQLWFYWDALSLSGPAALGFTATNNVIDGFMLPKANVATAMTAPTSIAAQNVTNVSDAFMQLDPTLNTPNSTGVNQFLAIVADQLGTIYPAGVEIIYSPRYLWPL